MFVYTNVKMIMKGAMKILREGPYEIRLMVPDPVAVKEAYILQQSKNREFPFPYWAKIWPAAKAMAEFLATNPGYINGKKILEIAAGLGLPSMVAAQLAREVIVSDYLPEAVEMISQSVMLNGYTNVECRVINWNKLPAALEADVLLLSDINYEPSDFEQLKKLIQYFLSKKTTVILTTPQRLIAKSFIEEMMPHSIYQETIQVKDGNEMVWVSVFILSSSLLPLN
jgi:predicted nicotinamide N-methyase